MAIGVIHVEDIQRIFEQQSTSLENAAAAVDSNSPSSTPSTLHPRSPPPPLLPSSPSSSSSPSDSSISSSGISSNATSVAGSVARMAYDNPVVALEGDDDSLTATCEGSGSSRTSSLRSGCVGVLSSMHDHVLCIDFEASLPDDLRPPPVSLAAFSTPSQRPSRHPPPIVSIISERAKSLRNSLFSECPATVTSSSRSTLSSSASFRPRRLSPDTERLALPLEEPSRPSCTLVYVAIIVLIVLVLLVGAVTTIMDVRPAFLFGAEAETNSTALLVENATLIDLFDPSTNGTVLPLMKNGLSISSTTFSKL